MKGVAFPVLHQMRRDLDDGKWPEVAARLRGWMQSDPNAVWLAVSALVEDDDREPRLQRWADADPADTLLNAVYAHRLVVHAWNVRSGARAANVTSDQFQEW